MSVSEKLEEEILALLGQNLSDGELRDKAAQVLCGKPYGELGPVG